jgi:hypothetical protein
MKKFHSMCLQTVCDLERIFWNIYAGQPGGVHFAAQFVWSGFYAQLQRRDILSKVLN